MSERQVAGVRLSNPDKILYPEQGITKGDLADHYLAVAPFMLPHVAGRPITLVRCPTGRQRNCFYQRHAGAGLPRQIRKVTVPGFDNPYLYVEDVAGLIALVQVGMLEIHPWGVTIARPTQPDRMVLDLDPGEGLSFDAVIEAALELRERLAALGLESFVKTTGGKGLHVVLPIEPRHDWPMVKGWAKRFADNIAAELPNRYLTRIAKAERSGRIFIDYLRNDPTSTAIAPYSTRSRPGGPVAMPLAWNELESGLDPGVYTVRTAAARVASVADPWARMGSVRQALPELD